MKKVIIVTPRSPFQGRGADEQDRLCGIEWFINNGYGVQVITKTFPSDFPHIEESKKRLNISITGISYKYRGKRSLVRLLRRLVWPPYWDGAAFEYTDREIQNELKKQIEEFKPDFVWFDYTYLWPLYHIPLKKKIPIITRSINFEPDHFLDEDGRTPLNYFLVLFKYLSEITSFRKSAHFFSITPKEEKIYRKFGKTSLSTLPLRSLCSRLEERETVCHEGLHIGFTPSTFTVSHNLQALLFIIRDVYPLLPEEVKKITTIHVTGNKFPESLKIELPKSVKYDGFVPNSIDFWKAMDISFSPSLFGAGMQQKIFEPIALGVPTITSKRGLADYPFECGVHVVCASSKEEVVSAIIGLYNNKAKAQSISREAQKLSRHFFSKTRIDWILKNGIRSSTKK
ncbi:MAG: glycosyltransferase [Patescibacteria group bacterium]